MSLFDLLKQTKEKHTSAREEETPAAPAPVSEAPVPTETPGQQAAPEATCCFCGRRFAYMPSLLFLSEKKITCPVCRMKQPAPKAPVPAAASPAPEAPVPQTAVPPDMTCRFCGWRFTDIPWSRHCPICCTAVGAPVCGQPLIPTQIKRENNQTCIVIDLNALPSDDTLIVVASTSSHLGCSFAASHRLRRVGRATFESSAFGWMERRKTGDVFCIDRSSQLSGDALQAAAEGFGLPPYIFQSANVAFLMEESSFSNSCIEIAAITGIRAEVLARCCDNTRYDMVISEVIGSYCPPRLISLMVDE